MDADRVTLSSTYREMTTEELLRLHGEGTLTEEAYDAIESALKSRKIDVPSRPSEKIQGPVLKNQFSSPAV